MNISASDRQALKDAGLYEPFRARVAELITYYRRVKANEPRRKAAERAFEEFAERLASADVPTGSPAAGNPSPELARRVLAERVNWRALLPENVRAQATGGECVRWAVDAQTLLELGRENEIVRAPGMPAIGMLKQALRGELDLWALWTKLEARKTAEELFADDGRENFKLLDEWETELRRLRDEGEPLVLNTAETTAEVLV